MTPIPPMSESQKLTNIRHALDQSAIVAITDRRGNITHVNDRFCLISKYTREDLMGQNHRIVNSGHHAASFFTEMWRTISSGKIWEGEIRNRAKDGTHYWVHTTIVPQVGPDHQPYEYVSIRYEITQRKQAEEELRIYADRLERSNQAIIEREAQILMQDRLASVGLLASSLAHEIGTPLGVIRGRAEYLALQLQENDTIRKNVDIIVAQIDRVSALIRSLLNLARGERSAKKTTLFVGDVVHEVLELMAHELRKHRISIDNQVRARSDVQVVAESAALHQVFLNLLVNSVHAIEAAIRTQNRSHDHMITVRVKDEDAQWAIGVSDTGAGISDANLRNLFKPFFTTKDVGMGTGLGLVISYRIVESFGGTIRVESREGVGTTFWVVFPKQAERLIQQAGKINE